jgi:hypothetical protein
MRLPKLEVIGSLFLAATLSAPAWGTNTSAKTAVPGTLNYVEGQVSMGSQPVDSKSIGSAELRPGESLTTEQGKAEILLTPGVFLRVGDNSSVKMISPSLTDTEVGLSKGQAMVEVAEIHPQNNIRITEGGATAQLLKTGLYDFDSAQGQLRVFEGKALVEDGGGNATVKSGRELSLAGNGPLKAEKFNQKSYEEGDLYRWSSLRSAYLAEANVDAAGLYAVNGWGPWGPGWWGFGWYWDPWFNAFTFIPGDGMFFSPFGWGFYSPGWVYRAPFYGAYRYGYGRYYHQFSTDYRSWGPGPHYVEGRDYAGGMYRGPGSSGGGFRSGSARVGAAPGGGLHPSGAFHGGGDFHGGGGFHGR